MVACVHHPTQASVSMSHSQRCVRCACACVCSTRCFRFVPAQMDVLRHIASSHDMTFLKELHFLVSSTNLVIRTTQELAAAGVAPAPAAALGDALSGSAAAATADAGSADTPPPSKLSSLVQSLQVSKERACVRDVGAWVY